MKAFHKPYGRTTSGIQRWFQFRLRTLLCIMVLVSFASSLWHPVIRPWLDSRQQSDEKIDIAALVQALKKRISPSGATWRNDDTGTSANANQSPNDRR